MTYPHNSGELSAVFRPSAANDSVTFPNGTVPRFIAPSTATGGRFGLFEWNMAGPRGERDSGHFHKTFSESFYILEGTISLYNGEKWLDATPGDFLYVPPGGVHAFSNNSDSPASMLVLYAPGVAIPFQLVTNG